MSFLTWRCDLPQKLQRSCSFESVGRAISLPSRPRCGERPRSLVLRDHPVDDAVLARLLGGHEVVALGVAGDLLVGLAGVLGDDAVQALAYVDDLARVDLDVGRLALEARAHLVDQDL